MHALRSWDFNDMTEKLESSLRTESAYALGHSAIKTLREIQAWPTPLNYELALHYVGDPDGPLACAVNRLLQDGAFHSDDWAEKLARDYLPRLRFQHEVIDAGDRLASELSRTGRTLDAARDASARTSASLQQTEKNLGLVREAGELAQHVRAVSHIVRKADAEALACRAELESSAAKVHELQAQIERMRRDAMTDPLTSLSNRRAFDEQLQRCCSETDASGTQLSLAMIDIDHFKVFNDTWGHQTGDQVLRFIGSVLTAACQPPRLAGRYGGEEFAIVFPRHTMAEATAILETLRFEVSKRPLKRRTTGDDLGRVTISIGLAEHRSGEEPHAFLARADEALYASKRAGRNRLTIAAEPDPVNAKVA